MTKKYDYKILPETWKSRALVLAALVGGATLMIAYYVWLFTSGFGFFAPWGWLDKIDVTYVNQTNERVLIYKDSDLAFTLEPGETRTDTDYKLEWWWDRDVAAFDDRGRVLFADELDRDDLKDLHYRIVIDD